MFSFLFFFLLNDRCSPGSGPLQLVVIGDSLTKFLDTDIFDATSAIDVRLFRMRGATVKMLQEAIECDLDILQELKSDVVFIHVGPTHYVNN